MLAPRFIIFSSISVIWVIQMEEPLVFCSANPVSDDAACPSEVAEQTFAQTFITQPLVKTFDKGILHGLARPDIMSAEAHILPLLMHSIMGHRQLRIGTK